MNTFQLDENLNDKNLADKCNSEKLCVVKRFPNRLKGAKDDVVLPDLLTKEAPFVTRDFPIVSEHRDQVPRSHSGIIVVRSKIPSRPFTTQSAARNLAKFKNKFPSWSTADWKQIYIEIDEDEIFITKVHESNDVSFTIALGTADFSSQLQNAMNVLSNIRSILS
jgi:hypothetical protein